MTNLNRFRDSNEKIAPDKGGGGGNCSLKQSHEGCQMCNQLEAPALV
jgi:hypothetical protein